MFHILNFTEYFEIKKFWTVLVVLDKVAIDFLNVSNKFGSAILMTF